MRTSEHIEVAASSSNSNSNSQQESSNNATCIIWIELCCVYGCVWVCALYHMASVCVCLWMDTNICWLCVFFRFFPPYSSTVFFCFCFLLFCFLFVFFSCCWRMMNAGRMRWLSLIVPSVHNISVRSCIVNCIKKWGEMFREKARFGVRCLCAWASDSKWWEWKPNVFFRYPGNNKILWKCDKTMFKLYANLFVLLVESKVILKTFQILERFLRWKLGVKTILIFFFRGLGGLP